MATRIQRVRATRGFSCGKTLLFLAERLETRVLLSTALFQSQTTFIAPGGPGAVAIADLTGDGNEDLIINQRSDAVEVLLGNGNGTFQSPLTFATGSNPNQLAVGDVNGDGKPDIVVANFYSNTVGVLLGNGNGTFQPMQSYPVGYNPTSVAIADLNGDGLPDIVVANNNGLSKVGILPNNGNGTFGPMQFLSTAEGVSPRDLAVADLTGDGDQDIVVTNSGSNTVGVFLGNGNGTFQPPQTFATGPNPFAVAVADVNGDGKPDILVENHGNYTLGVLLGNGNGTFAPEQTYATGDDPYSFAVADVNGDGAPDVVVAQASQGTIGVLVNNGNGTFQAPLTFAAGADPLNVAVGDVNGDGKPDVVVTNYAGDTASVFLGTGYTAPIITQSGATVTATGTSENDTASITTSNGDVVVTIDSVTDSFPLSSITGLNISLGGGNDVLKIGKNAPPVTVGGGAGADTIVAHNSNDDIKGGKGADLLVGDGSAETVSGGKGSDTLAAGKGTGSELMGGKGADLFVNDAGSSDTIDGGTGVNLASFNTADTFENIFEIYNAPAGFTQPDAENVGLTSPADASGSVVPALQTITDGVTLDTLSTGALKIVGTSGNDSISLSTDGVNLAINVDGTVSGVPLTGLTGVVVVGGEGNDSLSADSSLTLPLTLRGGAGNDTLVGGGGQCVLVGGAGNDSLIGGDGVSLLVPGARLDYTNAPTGNDTLMGGSGPSYADFSHRTDNLYLSNDNTGNSGDTAAGEATVIESSVTNIFAGTGNDTIVSTTPGSFLSAGYGSSQLTSAGTNTVLTAGPQGAGSDSVTANSASNVLFLANNHADTYGGTVSADILQTDSTDVLT